MTGLSVVFQKALHPCGLDESSLSIGSHYASGRCDKSSLSKLQMVGGGGGLMLLPAEPFKATCGLQAPRIK